VSIWEVGSVYHSLDVGSFGDMDDDDDGEYMNRRAGGLLGIL
jgi:hypothetical protein